jgi:hypothetical protein
LTGFARRGYFGATESTAIQYFSVRSAGNDRALIDDFSYAVAVPEPNAAMLLGLGLLTPGGVAISCTVRSTGSSEGDPDRPTRASSSEFVADTFEVGRLLISELDQIAAACPSAQFSLTHPSMSCFQHGNFWHRR